MYGLIMYITMVLYGIVELKIPHQLEMFESHLELTGTE